MRARSVVVLCLISAAVGAAADHYWGQLSPLAHAYWNKIQSFTQSGVLKTEQKTTRPSGVGKVEVLGDRVRCDNRYQELKIPESEYRAFFDQCMGNTGSTKKEE
jgi:hypothetical protein